jgi:hypothetical protein
VVRGEKIARAKFTKSVFVLALERNAIKKRAVNALLSQGGRRIRDRRIVSLKAFRYPVADDVSVMKQRIIGSQRDEHSSSPEPSTLDWR